MTGLTVDVKINVFASLNKNKGDKTLNLEPSTSDTGAFNSIPLGSMKNGDNRVTEEMLQEGLDNIEKRIKSKQESIDSLREDIEDLVAMRFLINEELNDNSDDEPY